MRHYRKIINYSKDDKGFIAVAPELPGCSAFGDTEEEALAELRIAISLHLEVKGESGMNKSKVTKAKNKLSKSMQELRQT